MPSTPPPASLPTTTCQVPRTWVPSRADSPRSPGVAMVPAQVCAGSRVSRCRAPDWTGLLRSGANSIAAQLGLDVPAPRLLPPPPPPSPQATRPPPPEADPGVSRRAPGARATSATWRKERVSAVELSPGHSRVNGAEGRGRACCPLSSTGGGAAQPGLGVNLQPD